MPRQWLVATRRDCTNRVVKRWVCHCGGRRHQYSGENHWSNPPLAPIVCSTCAGTYSLCACPDHPSVVHPSSFAPRTMWCSILLPTRTNSPSLVSPSRPMAHCWRRCQMTSSCAYGETLQRNKQYNLCCDTTPRITTNLITAPRARQQNTHTDQQLHVGLASSWAWLKRESQVVVKRCVFWVTPLKS